jgi:hypothetical protein
MWIYRGELKCFDGSIVVNRGDSLFGKSAYNNDSG